MTGTVLAVVLMVAPIAAAVFVARRDEQRRHERDLDEIIARRYRQRAQLRAWYDA